jgi:hypothetical protein
MSAITILVLGYLIYEANTQLKAKRYTCHKCNIVILVRPEDDYNLYHNCDKYHNITRLYKD